MIEYPPYHLEPPEPFACAFFALIVAGILAAVVLDWLRSRRLK